MTESSIQLPNEKSISDELVTANVMSTEGLALQIVDSEDSFAIEED
jgi:hypothetical protein